MTLVQPPETMEEFNRLLEQRHEALSGRLQQVADFVVSRPRVIALDTMADIGEQIGVSPSTLSRFAQALGYANFRPMQQVFREHCLGSVPTYHERVKQACQQDASTKDIFNAYSQANAAALDNLELQLEPELLQQAVSKLSQADTIYLQGARRAHPVAFFLWYMLSNAGRNVILLDDPAGVGSPLVDRMGTEDALLAITYSPASERSRDIIQQASDKGVPVVAISDHKVKLAQAPNLVRFEVCEGEVLGFRSLTSSMQLAQTLVVSLLSQGKAD